MSIDRKASLIQAAAGALVLTLLIQPAFALGYASVVWLLFLPLPVFFAMGPNPRNLPGMAASFVAGQLWCWLHLSAMDVLAGVLPMPAAGMIVGVVVVFAMLAVHQVALARTVVGCVPALFMGFSLSFFVADLAPAGTPLLNPFVLTGMWAYGLVLCMALLLAGGAACRLILGSAWVPPHLARPDAVGEAGATGAEVEATDAEPAEADARPAPNEPVSV
ncbi:DUF1097 family protein [Demequina pelophila]|uniref:DUF1097 family protein n=1 Tax=Demequina pelophila TaxID=1638984 RepID=UPI0007811BE3|nr:DUF1097 family protein [Demequina pelophila]